MNKTYWHPSLKFWKIFSEHALFYPYCVTDKSNKKIPRSLFLLKIKLLVFLHKTNWKYFRFDIYNRRNSKYIGDFWSKLLQ